MTGITVEEIDTLINNRTPEELKKLGGVQGIVQKLGTNIETGLTEAQAKEPSRLEKFGSNRLPDPPIKSFMSLVLDGLQDKTLIMLIIAATVSLLLGIFEDPKSGWIEGTAILVAVIVVVMVSSANDYQKERQFRKLNARKNNKPVKVMRGGRMEQISVYDIVVGDVVVIDTGDILCADGLFLSGYNMKCDESTMTGESDACKKSEESPFLLASCQVIEGIGKMVVTAVGTHSIAGHTMMLLQKPAEDTPLQIKLEHLADSIAKFGLGAALAIFVSLLGKLVYGIWTGHTPLNAAIVGHVIKFVVTSITVVVVAVPEGLPLAVTIALAYSMTKMLKDNNLVRHLEACETMGGATTICSDKTGTLTTNRMTVVKGWAAGKVCDSAEDFRAALGPMSQLLWEGIAVNSTATEAANEKGVVEFVGSKTECALLGLLKSLGIDYAKLRDSIRKIKLVPFSSARKRMSTVARVATGEFVFTKGASEIVLSRCTHIVSGGAVPLTDAQRADVLKTISAFASQTLRTICLAYRPVGPDDAKALDPAAAEELNETLENKLILLAVVGIKDPLRDEVPDAVRHCKQAGIVVRMVTGDNVETARAIATECGILTDGVIIQGPEFRALSEKEREDIAPRIQVMARSAPTDKYMLVQALKHRSHVVAVTGDGTNDAPALKESNVGFAMGIAGTEVSKEASDIILMDDNFSSIVKAAMWGRNVYDSIRKFLQFQLTVNVVAVLLAFVGAITSTHGEPPLKPVQLLWVNLIMDTMAALALATDAPSPDLLKRKPYGKNDSLITRRMYSNIIGQAIFQLTVNLLVLYQGPAIFGFEAESVEHLTCVFNVFVICQLFNEINSRMLTNEFNVFSGFFRNRTFVGILVFTATAQFLITEYGGDFTNTRPLSLANWLRCIGIGALGIPVGMLIKLIPVSEAKAPVPSEVVAPKGSAIGAAGWKRLREQRTKIAAIGAFQNAGFASKLRRLHRVASVGFTCRTYQASPLLQVLRESKKSK